MFGGFGLTAFHMSVHTVRLNGDYTTRPTRPVLSNTAYHYDKIKYKYEMGTANTYFGDAVPPRDSYAAFAE